MSIISKSVVLTPMLLLISANIVFGFGKNSDEPKVGIENNIFSCEKSPKIKLKINDKFTYIGHCHFDRESTDVTDKNKHVGQIIDSYIFVNNFADKSSQAYFLISIFNHDRPHWTFTEDTYEGISKNRVLELGRQKIGEDNFYYSAFVGDALTTKERSYIEDKKFKLPNNMIVKSFRKAIGVRGRTLVNIIYIESLNDSEKYTYHDWIDTLLFDSMQKEFCGKFLANASESFEEIGVKMIPVKTYSIFQN